MDGPEIRYFIPYCAQCNTTFLFREESWLGGRSAEAIDCPLCRRELGMAEEDATLLAQATGDFGGDIDELILSLCPEDRTKVEDDIGTPEQRQAEHEDFIEKYKAQLAQQEVARARRQAGLPEIPDSDESFTEESPSPYPGLKPSEITDARWVSTQPAKKELRWKPDGTQTDRSGKWLVFIKNDKSDAMWAKIKSATEAGQLGYGAKVSTQKPTSFSNDQTVICVYTPDWKDEAEVKRVREELRQLGVTWPCIYKTNAATRAGKYSDLGHRVSKYRI